MAETPRFMQGVYQFEGKGLDKPLPPQSKIAYTVPGDKRVRPIYVRAGNSSAEMVCLVLTSNGDPIRYCPIGAKSGIDVGLHVIEERGPGTALEVLVAAPEGVKGTVVIDVGLMEA
ncbi:molybdopterin oxidoreductase [Methylocapsa aurea]|uniref:molybdopterin oxidoreductase n=1 Tax=Methylocapsa aurea TaxID=663610 RepID=UPI00055FCB3E|nr:molybdopterin oxidoreductase [Methylocapsa aurea]